MLQAMFSGVSGLQAHQTKLNVSGNNIANVNTIGFKAGRATFQDQLSQTLRSSARPNGDVGGQNPSQVGLGVMLGSVDTLQTQGNLQTTGKGTDLAIQGGGFFQVSSGDNIYYTRDGSFDLDSDGLLVNPASGLKLLGYLADSDGNIDLSQQVTSASTLKIPIGNLTAVRETTAVTIQGNLNASVALQSTRLTLDGQLDLSSSPGKRSITLYDELGNAHKLDITLRDPVATPAAGAGVPTGATMRWTVEQSMDGSAVPTQYLYAIPDGSGGNKFVFTDNANPANSLGSTLSLTVQGTGGASSFPITVDFSKLQANSEVRTAANGVGGSLPVQSTLLNISGNLNVSDSDALVNTTTVYDASGVARTVRTTLSNPVFNPVGGTNVPEGATQQWDMMIEVDTVPPTGFTKLYDSSVAGNLQSKVYYSAKGNFIVANGASPADSLGSTIELVAGALPPGSYNQGQMLDAGFPLSVNLAGLTTTNMKAAGDGQSGPSPIWNTSVRAFNSLGIAHLVNVKFSRALVGGNAPSTASARWEWTATVDGNVIADSKSGDYEPLFFDSSGKTLNAEKQQIGFTPTNGAKPVTIDLDFGALTQLSGDSSAAVTAQDGFAVGTLQSFSISPDGLISGIFSNGLNRTLGQVTLATFSNPAGLEKLGQNLFRDSSNSGVAQVGQPNVGNRGKISTGFVEMSNVDLSNEFTNLIITQRGFQANTRIITIVDDLLQDVINLKR
jgi:flagellar hook protein FlgE